ncbi:MAG: DinB family protein [Phycisphaerales bacterium]
MDTRAALKSQYHAALKTLRLAMEMCPEDRWNDPADGVPTFWRVSYHTLFYTHFYLQDDHEHFTPWEHHRSDAFEGDDGGPPNPDVSYTREQLLDYWHQCNAMVDERVDAMDLDAADCGFPWYPLPKLEHQLVNLRHIQHHAAALSSRLRREAGVAVPWVGRA